VFSINGAHYHTGDTTAYNQIRSDIGSRIFYEAKNSDKYVIWNGIEDNININSSYNKVITASKAIKMVDSSTMKEEVIGYILINYDVSTFTENFQRSSKYGAQYILIDNKNRIIFHPDNNMIGNKVNPVYVNKISENSNWFTDIINQEEVIITHINFPKSDWMMLGLIPIKNINLLTSSVSNSVLAIMAICLIVFLLFAFFITGKYLKPVRIITERFKDFKKGNIDFNKKLKVDSYDEIGELVKWFNTFLDSLKENKINQEELLKSREQYKSVVTNLTEIIFQIDRKGIFTFLNPAWETITGYSVEESIGTNSLNYIYPEDREHVESLFKHLIIRKEENFRYKIKYILKSGEIGWAEIFAKLILQRGKVKGISGTIMDITERKIMEQEIFDREKMLKGIADATNILLRETNHIEALNNALKILGEVTKVDRVYIFENHKSIDAEGVLVSQCFEWCREGIEPQIDDDSLRNISYTSLGIKHWYSVLSENNIINSLVEDLSESEQEILTPQRILSILVVPIFVEDYFWGFIGFDDCTTRRIWSKMEESTLKVAATSFGGAFKRIEAEEVLKNLLKDDFIKTIKNMQNFVFRIKKDETYNFVFTLFEGKIADELGLNTNIVYGKKINNFFERQTSNLIEQNIIKCFKGKTCNFELTIKNRVFYVILSPIFDNNSVAEIVGSASDITQNKETEEKIRYFAYYDMMTGLPNRTLFYDKLNLAISDVKESNKKIAVLFLDLDQFKLINDTLGHAAGDLLLKQVAKRLNGFMHNDDIVSRMGGDEFNILLKDIENNNDAINFAQMLLDSFRKPFIINEKELYVSTSIGISVYPNDGDNIETLLKNADIAMYIAKDRGRNNYKLFTTNMDTYASEKLNIVNKLRVAIEKEEFLLYYQPKMNLMTGNISGVEALIRWKHPKLGLISPNEFITLAEETGLIMPIGEWVIRTACEQNKKWHDAGFAHLSVSVNISAMQFQYQNIVKIVSDITAETGLNAKYLELEITENSIMENTFRTMKIIEELKQVGVKISIDDFGTGFSSMAYLKRFKVDKMKIDKSFIDDIVKSSSDAKITSSIINMAHSLNLSVVAEGVEKEEQLSLLRIYGCDEIQGYLLSKPLSATDCENFLENKLYNKTLYLE
jgi:diguanylate cyclase (GGDEF)-like protein/PAS domain S-box-containing protein